MILLLSGEGPSDIGQRNYEGDFVPGVMGRIIDQLTEPVWGFSPLASSSIEFLSKEELAAQSKDRKKAATLRGLKKGKGTAEFHKNAQVLAIYAKKLADQEGCEVGCILFRDCDGVRASSATIWKDKWSSMENGFKAQGCLLGVPMIPKPKSESWILCALQPTPYQNCAPLERLPGNDEAENAPKKVLAETLNRKGLGDSSTSNLNDLVDEGRIDAAQINMPSFNAFKGRLHEVLCEMLHKPKG